MEIVLPHIEILESKNLPSASTEPPPTDDTPPLAAIIDESDASNGLRRSINLIICSILVLLTCFYFSHHRLR
ncbi:hypothetical protein Nepgr_030977 [Nepenthes gracilis]|uniref:Uncharacterized protein n=1 Tax=Nepenthes gracilis TaxID=150966 RepID=A0AAD3THF2_NEPGR|nr:hypothetical protein Nepgr_030977 [Nepenthes gracilis]